MFTGINDSLFDKYALIALAIDETTIQVTNPGCSTGGGSIVIMEDSQLMGGSKEILEIILILPFLWTRSGGTFNTPNISGLSPADYTLTVTDNLCNTLFITSNPISVQDSTDFTVTNAVDNSTISLF